MIRRLLRFAVAAFSLLSLLAAAGTACLWWEVGHGQSYTAEASVLGTYTSVDLLSDGRTIVLVVRNWPGQPTVRLSSQHGYYGENRIWWTAPRMQPAWHRFGLAGESGQLSVFVRQDTREPLRWHPGAWPLKPAIVTHGPMPAWAAGGLPVWLVIAGLLLPPLLLEGRRWRQRRERRRRVRLGLCLACGYDRRHSPETCPESGTAAASVERQSNRAGASAADVRPP